MNTWAPRKFLVVAQKQSNSWRSTPCEPACYLKRRAPRWSGDSAKNLRGYEWMANELFTSLYPHLNQDNQDWDIKPPPTRRRNAAERSRGIVLRRSCGAWAAV